MLKRYFWLAYLLLVTVGAIMAADIARGYLTMRLSTPAAPAPIRTGTASTAPVERMALTDYAVIAERNLFNANPPSGGRSAGG